MQENLEPEHRGKDKNRERELQFFSLIEAWHGGEVHAQAADEDCNISYSEQTMDITLRGVGRVKRTQVARRIWQNGKIVHERFYYR